MSCTHIEPHSDADHGEYMVRLSNIKVINRPGAAKITYSLPDDQNLDYILVTYNINEHQKRQIKVNKKTISVVVDGFAKAGEYTVTLAVVNRPNIISKTVQITVRPTTPNYLLTQKSFSIDPGYGSVNIHGINPGKMPVTVYVFSYNDTTQKYNLLEQRAINNKIINFPAGPLNAKPQKLAVYTSDIFGNCSDTLFKLITPFPEAELDKNKFFLYKLSNDSQIGYNWELKYLFDGKLGDPGWHTTNGPLKMGTWGLGSVYKVSRFLLFSRMPDIYGYQNPKVFTLWGSAKTHPREHQPWPQDTTTVGTVLGDWQNLGNFIYPNPPSGLAPNQVTEDDRIFGTKGVSFKLSGGLPDVRFLRFQCTQTWGKLDYVNVKEITLFGNPAKGRHINNYHHQGPEI